MKVLVTGDRRWTDYDAVWRELAKLPTGTVVVHGAARGADSLADKAARRLGFEPRAYPADWEQYGLAAGPIRNRLMLKEEHRPGEPIDRVLTFHGDLPNSKGTRDMVGAARKAGIPVDVYTK
jgi:hypothetical protein